jgi:pimeloyl-ACP methyl ester carboxylesterase
LPGMKGTHLADDTSSQKKQARVWLTPDGLLNVPPLPDHHPDRDLALPLTYTNNKQDPGCLRPAGVVNYIVDLGAIQLLPFYGHITTLLEKSDRPTSCFAYDWRRNVQELVDEFYDYCCDAHPDQPVQVIGHSLGGLIAYAAMRKHPDKFKPGLTLVGVPFGTGIQYLQDMHRGYYTELKRCRQFLPETQFTMSSHWVFFPGSDEERLDSLVDVTSNMTTVNFVPDTSAIGQAVGEFRKAVQGDIVNIDFYSLQEWENHRLGIFGMQDMHKDRLALYRNHMDIQLKAAKEFRQRYLSTDQPNLPPLVVCASDSVPTINQILRRTSLDGSYEYDYVSGRSVPGDGRVYFDAAFPPSTTHHSVVRLQSMHAKQLLWETKGGDLGSIWQQVVAQLHNYESEKPLSSMATAQTKVVSNEIIK